MVSDPDGAWSFGGSGWARAEVDDPTRADVHHLTLVAEDVMPGAVASTALDLPARHLGVTVGVYDALVDEGGRQVWLAVRLPGGGGSTTTDHRWRYPAQP